MVLLEVALVFFGLLLVSLGFLTGQPDWQLLALIVFGIVIIIHMAVRNKRQEMQLSLRHAQVVIPKAPRIPEYNPRLQRVTPQRPRVVFPPEPPGRATPKPPPPMTLRTLTCLACGATLRQGARFCHRCGRPTGT